MGIEAVLALMRATPDSEALVVTLDGNSSVCLPLMQCVHKTQAVARAMATKNWEVAVQLRGSGFKRNLGKVFFMVIIFRGCKAHSCFSPSSPGFNSDISLEFFDVAGIY